ncbi:phosphohistidine phosphatase [Helicobacter jaachi]|uniref:Phosphohistidine phosphatase n=1 Tax=Helicobacter jaachi TaxID=1677920 RepID=A0A4U8TDJ2_9HELI|nr:phosphoglycerate mutase family protein [Helicobacter jaachi]TLD96727.1 phosphohistidine phosphatase [Helicobacter jaachi]
MKTITLLRHADTISREEYRLKNKTDKSDIFRPLSKLGKAQSKLLARFIIQHLNIDMVFCSPAKRTQQTFKPLSKYIPTDSIMLCDEIAPDCGLDGYMKLTQTKAFQKASNVLIIGHQPDLKSFATYLCPSFRALVPKGVLMRFIINPSAQTLESEGIIDFILPPFMLEDFKK